MSMAMSVHGANDDYGQEFALPSSRVHLRVLPVCFENKYVVGQRETK